MFALTVSMGCETTAEIAPAVPPASMACHRASGGGGVPSGAGSPWITRFKRPKPKKRIEFVTAPLRTAGPRPA